MKRKATATMDATPAFQSEPNPLEVFTSFVALVNREGITTFSFLFPNQSQEKSYSNYQATTMNQADITHKQSTKAAKGEVQQPYY